MCEQSTSGVGNLGPAGRMRPLRNSAAACQTCRGKKSKGAIPYIGQYHLPVNSIRSLFLTQILHPMTPFFTTVHIQRLFFSKLECKAHTSKIFVNFSAKKGKFSLEFDQIYTE